MRRIGTCPNVCASMYMSQYAPHATLSHPLYHQLKMFEHMIEFYFMVLNNSESNSQKEKNIALSISVIKVTQKKGKTLRLT